MKLDTPTRAPGNIHIVSLRNADASDVAKTLRRILGRTDSSDTQRVTTNASIAQSTSGAGSGTGSLPQQVR